MCIPVGVTVQPVRSIIFSAVDHKTVAGHLSDCASKVLTQAVVEQLGIAPCRSSSRLEFLACPVTLTDRSLHQSCFVPSITFAAQLNTQASMIQRTTLLLCWGMLIDSAGVNQIFTSRTCRWDTSSCLAAAAVLVQTHPLTHICLMQATMLSLVSPEVMPPSDPTQGFPPAALQPLLSWFRHTLQQQPIALHNQVQDVDELDAPANGLETVTEQLQAVVTAKEGTAEQLQTVFVALCRAHGLLVRSVRCALHWVM